MHYSTMMGCITPKEIKDLLVEAACKNQIPYQVDCLAGTFLDSTSVHLTKGGIPTGAMCFPRRYSHSPVEVANFNDIENACRLLVASVEFLPKNRSVLEKE